MFPIRIQILSLSIGLVKTKGDYIFKLVKPSLIEIRTLAITVNDLLEKTRVDFLAVTLLLDLP